MRYRTPLSVTALFVLGCFLPGCYLPFGFVEVTRPDPLRKKAVKVVKVSGRTVTLTDGRQVELAGLEVPSKGIDPNHARDIQADMAWSLRQEHVVVVPEAQGRGRLLAIDMREETRYHGPGCLLMAFAGSAYDSPDVPVVILIPIFVDKPAERWDVGAHLLWAGLARPRPDEIADPQVRASYLDSARSAREQKRGIWMGPNERLLDAIRRGNVKAVQYLLDHGANPNWADDHGCTPLILAACHKEGLERMEIVLGLLDAGADPNLAGQEKVTPLHAAAEAGNVRTAALLLQRGAHINAVAKRCGTPVMAAARTAQGEMVRFLLGHGADLKRAGGAEMALLYFSRPGDLEIVKLLAAHGANPNAIEYGNTPLHLAAGSGASEIAKFLISQGADVNAKNLSGSTPLHRAAGLGHREVVRLLASKGADVNARDNGRRTPLDLAREGKHREVAEILRAHGARE